MQKSLVELFEHLDVGLLWLGPQGEVRHANADAAVRTGLLTGHTLADGPLRRAAMVAASAQMPRPARFGTAGGDLSCRAIPGLGRDDAFVLVARDGESDPARTLDTVMGAVGESLRPSLRKLRASLDLWHDHDASHAAQALGDGVDEVLGALDRLLDLAAVRGQSVPGPDERIELWPLLQGVWAEVEPLAIEREVELRFLMHGELAVQVTLYGNRRWIRRVFRECLEQAIRRAPRGGSLDVEHRQCGPRAQIVLHDSAVFADGHGAISLELCRHVLALHGGRMDEEVDDGRRHWVIDLPTGAPHHTADAEIGIAQAQIVARDLAALLARARRPAGAGA